MPDSRPAEFATLAEIDSQYDALRRTVACVADHSAQIREFFGRSPHGAITYVGSGSSYCLCQSAELTARIRLGRPATAIAAGDLMLNYPHYRSLLRDGILVAPSRSGATTEVVAAFRKVRAEFGLPCMGICAAVDSPLAAHCDLTLEIPWAFDRSVCQTRTVSNLYAANLVMVGALNGDTTLLREIDEAVDAGERFMERYTAPLREIAERTTWQKAVVLGDSEIQGIAAESAVALMEIPQVPANYYHVLDVRHGPMVLLDSHTLVIMAVSPYGVGHQRDLVRDLKAKGCLVVTVGPDAVAGFGSDLHVSTAAVTNYAVMGIPFIFVPQIIGYYRAVASGINPDRPQGLDSWIELAETRDDDRSVRPGAEESQR